MIEAMPKKNEKNQISTHILKSISFLQADGNFVQEWIKIRNCLIFIIFPGILQPPFTRSMSFIEVSIILVQFKKNNENMQLSYDVFTADNNAVNQCCD